MAMEQMTEEELCAAILAKLDEIGKKLDDNNQKLDEVNALLSCVSKSSDQPVSASSSTSPTSSRRPGRSPRDHGEPAAHTRCSTLGADQAAHGQVLPMRPLPSSTSPSFSSPPREVADDVPVTTTVLLGKDQVRSRCSTLGPYQAACVMVSASTSVAPPMPSPTSTPPPDSDLAVPCSIYEQMQVKHAECLMLCGDSDISTSKAPATVLLMKNMLKDISEPVSSLKILLPWLFVAMKLGTQERDRYLTTMLHGELSSVEVTTLHETFDRHATTDGIMSNHHGVAGRYYYMFDISSHAFRPLPWPSWIYVNGFRAWVHLIYLLSLFLPPETPMLNWKLNMNNNCTLIFDPGITLVPVISSKQLHLLRDLSLQKEELLKSGHKERGGAIETEQKNSSYPLQNDFCVPDTIRKCWILCFGIHSDRVILSSLWFISWQRSKQYPGASANGVILPLLWLCGNTVAFSILQLNVFVLSLIFRETDDHRSLSSAYLLVGSNHIYLLLRWMLVSVQCLSSLHRPISVCLKIKVIYYLISELIHLGKHTATIMMLLEGLKSHSIFELLQPMQGVMVAKVLEMLLLTHSYRVLVLYFCSHVVLVLQDKLSLEGGFDSVIKCASCSCHASWDIILLILIIALWWKQVNQAGHLSHDGKSIQHQLCASRSPNSVQIQENKHKGCTGDALVKWCCISSVVEQMFHIQDCVQWSTLGQATIVQSMSKPWHGLQMDRDVLDQIVFNIRKMYVPWDTGELKLITGYQTWDPGIQKSKYLLSMYHLQGIAWSVIKAPVLHTFKLSRAEAMVVHLKHQWTTAWGQAVFQGGKDVRNLCGWMGRLVNVGRAAI